MRGTLRVQVRWADDTTSEWTVIGEDGPRVCGTSGPADPPRPGVLRVAFAVALSQDHPEVPAAWVHHAVQSAGGAGASRCGTISAMLETGCRARRCQR